MKLVVVGGGTAGWLTALYAKKQCPNADITLIENEKIGILGAGEASTPHLINMLDALNIPTSDIIKNTNATIKNTAKFTGWSKNKKDYFYHPFDYLNNNVSEKHGYIDNLKINTNFYHLYSYLNNINMNQYCMINKICNNNLVPFVKTKKLKTNNMIEEYDQIMAWSLNFDAKMFAEYLKKIAKLRGIKKINGTVKEILLDEKDNINFLKLENNEKIKTNFVFDCTGFARLIIGKFYKSKWISYNKYLPTNKALPFFLDIDSDKSIPPYIEAIAMDYGWMWKTPLQNRYGCGYVFDENYISVDMAKQEVEKMLGFEVFPPKIFSFEAGCYEKIWIKNCLAVGLSAGFVEPLEATAIMHSIIVLFEFFKNAENLKSKNLNTKNNFNIMFEKQSYSIMQYIYWHYVTNKNNTEFWKNFKNNSCAPEELKNILKKMQNNILEEKDFLFLTKESLFNTEDYLCVFWGHKVYKNKFNLQNTKELKILFKKLINEQNDIIKKLEKHNVFLEKMKS